MTATAGRRLRLGLLLSPVVFLLHDAEEYLALFVMARSANGVTHVLQAVALRGYVPGLGTALAVVLPFAPLGLASLLT